MHPATKSNLYLPLKDLNKKRFVGEKHPKMLFQTLAGPNKNRSSCLLQKKDNSVIFKYLGIGF